MRELLEELAATPTRLERLVANVPPSLLGWVPPDWEACPAEHFTLLGTVCHLRDLETDGYHVRLRRAVTEDLPDLASVDGFQLERDRRYAEADLGHALAAFRLARAQSVELVSQWRPEDAARKVTFAEYGTLTARGLLELLHSHDLQHLSGVRWLLARASALNR